MIVSSALKSVFSMTFLGTATKLKGCIDCRHSTPELDRIGFCPARFLCHGNGLPDMVVSVCLAQENWEMYPGTHFGKLCKNEMTGGVR
jgi:hypothetical protein